MASYYLRLSDDFVHETIPPAHTNFAGRTALTASRKAAQRMLGWLVRMSLPAAASCSSAFAIYYKHLF